MKLKIQSICYYEIMASEVQFVNDIHYHNNVYDITISS